MSVASLPQGARVHKCYSAPASRTDFGDEVRGSMSNECFKTPLTVGERGGLTSYWEDDET